MKIQQRRPNYFDGFEDEEANINTLEELKLISFVQNAINYKGFYGLFNSKSSFPDAPDILMALYNYDEKYNGCKIWWAIGYIFGDGNSLGLEEYSKYIGDHLDDCPQKIYQHDKCNCGFRT
jgi:hypothetical protein